MGKHISFIILGLLKKLLTACIMGTLFFACASFGAAPESGRNLPPEPVPPEVPPVPEQIMGRGNTGQRDLAEFLLAANTQADRDFVSALANYYIEEAAAEGVNHDVAFAQMCLETGYLRYGGLVTPDMNNFCGLGAIGPEKPGERFPTPQIGVRAHIQHLKAYASEEPLKGELVDPRYRWVKYGSSPTIYGLAGTWAADREYGTKLKAILDRLYQSAFVR